MRLTGRATGRRAKSALAAPISSFDRKRAGQIRFFHEFADTIAPILASLAEDG
jgi:hypothetical protein